MSTLRESAKVQFKSAMSAYRKSVKAACRKGVTEAIEAMKNDSIVVCGVKLHALRFEKDTSVSIPVSCKCALYINSLPGRRSLSSFGQERTFN